MNNKLAYVVSGVAVAIVIAMIIFSSFSQPVVTAQGFSQIDGEPDVFKVFVSIEGKDIDTEKAKEKHDVIYDSFVSKLKAEGLEKKMKVSSYNIYPEYEWINNRQILRGYVVSSQLELKLETFEDAVNVVDVAVLSNAPVSSVNFELSDERQAELKSKALEEAGKDAKRKAEATAKGLDKKLGRLVEIESEEFRYYPFEAYKDSSSVESADMAIREIPREIKVSASLRVKYKLK